VSLKEFNFVNAKHTYLFKFISALDKLHFQLKIKYGEKFWNLHKGAVQLSGSRFVAVKIIRREEFVGLCRTTFKEFPFFYRITENIKVYEDSQVFQNSYENSSQTQHGSL